jgi:hypothetical protein
MIMSSTHDLFIDFASFGAGRQTLQQMDGRSFAKLCRDCRLIDRALTLIDVDILFTKVKVRALACRVGCAAFKSVHAARCLIRCHCHRGMYADALQSHLA